MHALVLAAMLLAAEPPRFETDVLPLLTKAGCNAGACHGAAAGRGGLKLSLFAGNPAADYDSLVRELEGRRINRAKPADSLFIAKPTGMIDHEGGVRFDFDGPEAKLLTNWVSAGAPRAASGLLRSISLQPAALVGTSIPFKARIQVFAELDDGSKRDVTGMSVFTPGDESALAAKGAGFFTVLRPGRHTVTVRYLSQVRSLSITARREGKPLDLSQAERHNWIDDEVLTALADLGMAPRPRASDAALLRRLSLSLTGRLPSSADVESYLADGKSGKFERLVERLLASEAFVDYWTWRLARQLRVRTLPNDERGTQAFHGWIREQVQVKTPLERMAKEMLVAEGDSWENGAANFHRSAPDARAQAEYLSEVLLGIRLRCANCHNHPLDRWTQDDYHGLAAIFARVDRGRFVRLLGSGEVIHPATVEAAQPKIPGGRFLTSDKDAAGDYRGELADWLIEKRTGLFARAQVNRLWKAMFGRGLVEPADDLRETNPATHPRLLDRLRDEFVDNGYDLRHLLRLIALSAAYQRSGVMEDDQGAAAEQFYAGYPRHSLEAEILLDASGDVTGVPESFPNQQAGTRSVQLVEFSKPEHALSVLGVCSRQESCDAAPAGADSLGQLTTQLHFLNGKLLNERLQDGSGFLAVARQDETPASKIVEQLYLRAYSRRPTQSESEFWSLELKNEPVESRQKKLQDLLWAILSSREFRTNH
ncbi:MAG: DUF1553 domain-containing protein [Pirellulaceae bacterium]|nr:DUF1553 domain-containing protein [Pirellulaceae bacterium]